MCAKGQHATCGCQTLLWRYPDIAAELHPTKNVDINLPTISYASNKLVRWLCERGCSTPGCATAVHEWESKIAYRTLGGNRCPYCIPQGKYLCHCRSLAFRFPEIAAEWHPDKNGDLRPESISAGSDKVIWWKCTKGHEWNSRASSRTGPRRTNCPQCNINKGEEFLRNWASDHPLVQTFTNKRRYEMVDPKTKKLRRLEPDGVLEFQNGRKAMIELDGPQHFESVGWYGPTPTDLHDQIRRDCTKNHWAREHGMSVLRVAYTEFRELESILTTFLEDAIQTQVFRCSNAALYNSLRSV